VVCCAAIDGAYFGATFPHLFLMTYPDLVPPPPTMVYVPRIFGFRIHKETKRSDAAVVSTGRQQAAQIMAEAAAKREKPPAQTTTLSGDDDDVADGGVGDNGAKGATVAPPQHKVKASSAPNSGAKVTKPAS
jgi:hypothetical protein